MERHISGRRVCLLRGDITRMTCDAIVNAANEQLIPGGGVSGAVHRAGGPAIAQEATGIGHCATGDAVATTAGDLQARHVIHAVAPVWRGGEQGEPELLGSAYRRSIEVADQAGDHSIAFPSLGTGIYGYPVGEAAPIALRTVIEYLASGDTAIEEVTFVLFSDHDLDSYRQALARL